MPVRGAEIAAELQPVFIRPDWRVIKAERIWHKTFDISRRKGTYWVFTLYEFFDEACSSLFLASP